ncbi:MAG: HAD-IIB family hydrolase [Clostridia bacterium]|nr:HAD-IIB family hydrolase [Clostridia bacterium]
MDHGTFTVIAFDLDGTLTQHKSKLSEQNRLILDLLREKYRLLMVGAGTCTRIWEQMDRYPIDIIGSYGMQFALYDNGSKTLDMQWDERVETNKEEMLKRADRIRERFGLYDFEGKTLEFHPTGALTFPVLGTKACLTDKLAYDPDREKRRIMYPFVKETFFDYNVMIGGSSSFDIVPGKYGKLNAIRRYLEKYGIDERNIVYCGDDYYEGGNDHDVYAGGVPFIKVDNYERFGDIIRENGLL